MTERDTLISRGRAIHALEKLALFRGISEGECAELLAICHGARFSTAQQIFKEGDPSFTMYVLISGAVEIHAEDAGLLHTMRPGEPFGEMGMICQIPRTAAALAREESVALRINKEEFDIFLAKFPRIGYILMKNITETLSQRLLRSRPKHPAYLL
ncbi:cyclic nucleotide-binding domain-containing protein [Endothiovibrio diazotrophicus]